MTDSQTDIEIIALEELFNEESHCEMSHTESRCSAAVTHVAVDCRRQFLICSSAHAIIQKMIKQRAKCVHCDKSASSCWRVVGV